MYTAKSWLPFLMTLAIVSLSIYLIPKHTAYAVAAILLAIVGYAWRTSSLLSEQLIAQHESTRDQTSAWSTSMHSPVPAIGDLSSSTLKSSDSIS
jgi:hypothetical protein